jgi:hypothetical protein
MAVKHSQMPVISGSRTAEKKTFNEVYRTCQNILVIGSFLLVFSSLFLPLLPPLVGKRAMLEGFPQLGESSVAAGGIDRVWVFKKTGLYYCPDSRYYGKLKPGFYMTQEQAIGHGYQPVAQDPCR